MNHLYHPNALYTREAAPDAAVHAGYAEDTARAIRDNVVYTKTALEWLPEGVDRNRVQDMLDGFEVLLNSLDAELTRLDKILTKRDER